MPGHRNRPYEDGNTLEPRIIDRNPLIENRSPEEPSVRRATSETRRPRSLTLFRVYNPLSRRYHSTTIVAQRPARRQLEEGSSSSTPILRRGRPSAPPPPPVIIQRTSSSVPPIGRVSEMPPTQGQQGHVSLPPKIPKEEPQQQSRDYESGRESRQSRRTQGMEDVDQILREASGRNRSPRRDARRSHRSGPFEVQEEVLQPSSPRSQQPKNFEFVQPYVVQTNEPIRSHQRDGDVRRSKEYIEMKRIADHNKAAADDAIQRCASAEVRLQNVQKQLEDMTMKANKTQAELDKTRHELEKCRHEYRVSSQERDIKSREAKVFQDQLELERQLNEQRERDRQRERERERDQEHGRVQEQERDRDREQIHDNSGSGNGHGSGRHRRHRRVVRLHQDRDAEPRTTNPRASTTTAATIDDPGTNVIEQARAESGRRGRA